MCPEDTAEVGALEAVCFSLPWTDGLVSHELTVRGSFSLVARETLGGPVLGYMVFRVAADAMDVLRLAVLPGGRRRGLGTELLFEGMRRARALGAAEAFLEVRENNSGARIFYEKAGFRLVGKRPGYYVETRETALVYARGLMDPGGGPGADASGRPGE
jgi:ribosomal-protein-alanine N-acetyltransferase